MGPGVLRRIDVVTLFPELVQAVVGSGVTGRAADAGLLELVTWNPRDFATDRHRTVDDRPYGGGPGMVMRYEPLRDAIHAARAAAPAGTKVAYLSPQGRRLDQAGIEELAGRPGLVLVAGRYEGVDERLVDAEIDEEWSLGDFVLSGGEIAAMAIVDCVTRLIPGALGDADSAEQDSFVDGLLDCPHYTRPEVAEGRTVPAVLLSGDHAAIRRWRRKQALGRTWQRRPDLIERAELDEEQRKLLDEYLAERR
ncbi:MAG: tRNA (guanosine(37)-N1)-methyltransferase TrmD [Gammaproteobacteria bacterium]|nr:tRNA (guanosine(37)-N1)-methyltransferase TrmD [Gammaproteobacteria bacterium]